MQKIRKLFSLFLAILMLAAILPISAEAVTPEAVEPVTVFYINPLYEGVIDSEYLSSLISYTAPRLLASFEASGTQYTDDLEAAVIDIRNALKNRSASFSVNVKVPANTDGKELIDDLFKRALRHTSEPDEGDYLHWHYAGYSGASSGYSDRTYNYLTIRYSVPYYTTAEQEDMVTAAIAEAIDSFGFTPYTSDYCKVKTVYEYIMSICTYDHEHLNDDSYTRKHSAYAALIDGTAVCQGYALLLYRMLLECGVECRLIAGVADNGNQIGGHAWNIVKLDGKWYNVDATWDDPRQENGISDRPYFLKCESTFRADHFRGDEYNTAAFHMAYPMAETDYIPDESRDFDLVLATADLTLLLRHVARISAVDDPEVLIRVDMDGNDILDAADATALARIIAAHTPAA